MLVDIDVFSDSSAIYSRIQAGSIRDVDWLTLRATQSYPLADTASGRAINKDILPQSFILDIQLLLPSKYNEDLSGAFYISAIQRHSGSFTVKISYHPAGSVGVQGDIECAVCAGISNELTITSTISERTYVIVPLSFSDSQLIDNPWLNKITGNLCAGNTATYTGGSLFFTHQSAAINSMCIKFLGGDHLQGIKVGDSFLTGVVQFQAGEGIAFTVNGNTIQVSVDKAALQTLWTQTIAAYFSQQEQEQEIIPIRSINGIPPDSNGNITISATQCVNISQVANGLVISNTCAKPCCTVDSALQNMQLTIKLIQQEQQVLRDYYINMSTTVNYMQANLSTLMRQF